MTVADALPEMIAADERDPRIQAALAELRHITRKHFPDATFSVTHGDDPEGIYLKPTVDVDDLDNVADVVTARLLQMQVTEGLPVYVIPIWPDARIAAYLRAKKPASAAERIAIAELIETGSASG